MCANAEMRGGKEKLPTEYLIVCWLPFPSPLFLCLFFKYCSFSDWHDATKLRPRITQVGAIRSPTHASSSSHLCSAARTQARKGASRDRRINKLTRIAPDDPNRHWNRVNQTRREQQDTAARRARRAQPACGTESVTYPASSGMVGQVESQSVPPRVSKSKSGPVVKRLILDTPS